eukprot:365460-Chlamydomonas_euryale.AAC.1
MRWLPPSRWLDAVLVALDVALQDGELSPAGIVTSLSSLTVLAGRSGEGGGDGPANDGAGGEKQAGGGEAAHADGDEGGTAAARPGGTAAGFARRALLSAGGGAAAGEFSSGELHTLLRGVLPALTTPDGLLGGGGGGDGALPRPLLLQLMRALDDAERREAGSAARARAVGDAAGDGVSQGTSVAPALIEFVGPALLQQCLSFEELAGVQYDARHGW